MKRLLLLLGMLVSCISFYGIPVKYVGCTPEDGSGISNFEFTLSFDISDAVDDLGTGEWGLGYQGNSKKRFTKLYEGSKETGTELATIMTSNFTGQSDGWTVGNDKITIVFPDGIIPKENQLYTLVINNNFVIYPKGEILSKSVTALKYETDPLILTFKGQKASDDNITLQLVSVSEGSSLESIKDVKYTFNAPISVNEGFKVQIKEGTSTVAESVSMTVENENTLAADFGGEISLYKSHSYIVYLPENSVVLASNPVKGNKAFSVNVNGNMVNTYPVASISLSDGDKCLPDKISLLYKLPKDTKLTGGPNQSINRMLRIYKTDISEENLVAALDGSFISANTGFEWDLSEISFEPSAEYILYREKGLGYLFDANNNRLPEWTNEETKIRFSTPSVEESGYAPMELGKPTLRGGGTVVNDGDSFSYIDRLEITAPNLRYEYDGNRVGFFGDDESRCKGYLYDITGETPQLVKEFVIDTQTRETTTSYYNILCMFINSILYEGHEYRIEMPEGAFTISAPKKLWNYVRTPAFALTVKGATPTEIKLQGTSIPEGAECSSLNDVIFKFNGDLTLNKDALGLFNGYDAQGKLNSTKYVPLTSYVSDNVTSVSAHVGNQASGNATKLIKGYRYTLTIPEGCVYVASMPEIANPETTLTIKGVEAPPVYTEPEYVSFSVAYLSPDGNINPESEFKSSDYTVAYSVANDVVKGNKITLKFDRSAWKLVHLIRYNGDSTTGTELKDFVEDGIYTSSPLKNDTRFECVLSYNGDLVFSNSTGVAELDKLNVSVFSDGDNIMVTGLEGSERITVYTATGLTLSVHDAADNGNVQIAAPKGQVYIVRIQRGTSTQAARIMH